MRTPKEIKRQIEGLQNQKEALPEYSKFGTPNWAIIEAQLDILSGGDIENYEEGSFEDEGEEFEIFQGANQVVDWLEDKNYDDLFDEEYEPKTNMIMSIAVIAVNDNITLVYKGETIVVNRLKNVASYEKVIERVKAGTEEDVLWLQENFKAIQNDLELKTNNNFTLKDGKAFLKGTDIPVPDAIMKKLVELEQSKEPMLPLLRFWRKLSQNPSEESRQDLYGFMIANNIPITEEGDIVTEKGVNQRSGGFPGDLVDARTGVIDNSIGCVVIMPRDKVNPDRNQTCSHGLHVGAPDYVRKFYSQNIIIECIVNPRDVVSVPTDYSNTKMRVCQYRVGGYSTKTSRKPDQVIQLTDFVTVPEPEQLQMMSKVAATDETTFVAPTVKMEKGTKVKKVKTLKKTKDKGDLNLEAMSASAIVAHVLEVTGEKITFNLKSKKSIVKKGYELIEIHKIKKANS